MGSQHEWVIPLSLAAGRGESLVGGKAAKLAQLAHAGFHVPEGFSIPTHAYQYFLEENHLDGLIRVELGRKPLESLRWEEIWDAALRIRSAFLAAPIPAPLEQAIGVAVDLMGESTPLAVRSSAPGEDSMNRSFAGLHESVVGVTGIEAVLQAVRVVWASLWSDAALLYRRELGLDPAHSRMAIVVQQVVDEDRSGVAFGRDPRDLRADRAIVEAVPGPCANLVDGLLDPDRWVLDRSSGAALEWRPGDRVGEQGGQPLLETADLAHLWQVLLDIETLMHWPPDTEWTGRGSHFTLLQARPITTAAVEPGDERAWYLSLRPSTQRLLALSQRVVGELIPRLEALGQRLAKQEIEGYDDEALAAAIEERHAAVQEWRQIYLEDFIPFAHGVRQLGLYYNDAVRPDDPYEFVGLLRGERMMAAQRNQALQELAVQLAANLTLHDALRQAAMAGRAPDDPSWRSSRGMIQAVPGGGDFVREFEGLLAGLLDVAYGGQRLADRPELILQTILEMAGAASAQQETGSKASTGDLDASREPSGPRIHVVKLDPPSQAKARITATTLEQRLLGAVGPGRQDEAQQMLSIGRLSWRLRDDDNLLVGRLDSQLLRALELAAGRLRSTGRIRADDPVGISASSLIAQALRDSCGGVVILPPAPKHEPFSCQGPGTEKPRQLVGQPASPGLATGRARSVRGPDTLARFRTGEVLVCDAIQPTMTHLVPLACAIVERRGGMLIHGAIIARELQIPCVNGVANAVDLVADGEVVTVDGYLGIVTIGPPEFDLETRTARDIPATAKS